MRAKLFDFNRIAIALDQRVLIFASCDQTVYKKCSSLLGFVGNVVHRATEPAKIAGIEHFCDLLLAFIKPQHLNLATRDKYNLFNRLVVMPILHSASNNGICMYFKLREDVIRNFCTIVFGDCYRIGLFNYLRNFRKLYAPHSIVIILHSLRIAEIASKKDSNHITDIDTGQNKRISNFEILYICNPNMVRVRGL